MLAQIPRRIEGKDGPESRNTGVFALLQGYVASYSIQRIVGHFSLADRDHILYNGMLYCSVRMAICLENNGSDVEMCFKSRVREHTPYLNLIRKTLNKAKLHVSRRAPGSKEN